jgi:hypothetical protein
MTPKQKSLESPAGERSEPAGLSRLFFSTLLWCLLISCYVITLFGLKCFFWQAAFWLFRADAECLAYLRNCATACGAKQYKFTISRIHER